MTSWFGQEYAGAKSVRRMRKLGSSPGRAGSERGVGSSGRVRVVGTGSPTPGSDDMSRDRHATVTQRSRDCRASVTQRSRDCYAGSR